MPERYKFKTVSEIYRVKASHLGLKLSGGVNGLENQVDSPRIQKLGLALAGYTDYLRSGRVQFLGRTEMNFLNRLGEAERKEACRRPFELELACIVITSGLEPPEELREYAKQFSVPILLTDSVSTRALDEISEYLEEELAPTTSIHAVLMEVLGLGVLLVGKSGIGKSECGLELVLRGHRLVSDDMVNIKRLGTERLVGAGPDFLQFHMELRGLGIINIRDLFGISSVSLQKQIDLAIELVRWRDRSEGDRVGFEEREYQLLETSVPLMTLPVASGRTVATLVEVAVRIHMLKKQGYEPGAEFLSQLEEKMRQAREERV